MSDLNSPDECSACGYETEALTKSDEPHAHPGREVAWLCDLCARTPSGNAFHYPEHYMEEANTLTTICYVGNAILAAIRAFS